MTEQAADTWAGSSAGALAQRWQVPALHLFRRVGSTNDVARTLALDGAPHGTCVVAEEQSAGRGRGGKAWSSAPGLGIWLSLLVRPREVPSPELLPILTGVAAAAALDPFIAPEQVGLKWPNDLYAGERKIGGILCEAVWAEGRISAVVAGIGLNVLHGAADFPDDLRDTSSSLRQAGGGAPDRVEVAGAVIRGVLGALSAPAEVLGGSVLGELSRRDVLRGHEVRVSGGTETRGVALGVSPAGALLIRDTRGVLRSITAGTVRRFVSAS